MPATLLPRPPVSCKSPPNLVPNAGQGATALLTQVSAYQSVGLWREENIHLVLE